MTVFDLFASLSLDDSNFTEGLNKAERAPAASERR